MQWSSAWRHHQGLNAPDLQPESSKKLGRCPGTGTRTTCACWGNAAGTDHLSVPEDHCEYMKHVTSFKKNKNESQLSLYQTDEKCCTFTKKKKKKVPKNVHGKHTGPHNHLAASFKCHQNLVTKEQHDLITFPWGMCLLSKGCPRLSYVCFKFLASPWFHFYLIWLSFTLLFISEAFWQAV